MIIGPASFVAFAGICTVLYFGFNLPFKMKAAQDPEAIHVEPQGVTGANKLENQKISDDGQQRKEALEEQVQLRAQDAIKAEAEQRRAQVLVEWRKEQAYLERFLAIAQQAEKFKEQGRAVAYYTASLPLDQMSRAPLYTSVNFLPAPLNRNMAGSQDVINYLRRAIAGQFEIKGKTVITGDFLLQQLSNHTADFQFGYSTASHVWIMRSEGYRFAVIFSPGDLDPNSGTVLSQPSRNSFGELTGLTTRVVEFKMRGGRSRSIEVLHSGTTACSASLADKIRIDCGDGDNNDAMTISKAMAALIVAYGDEPNGSP